MDRATKRRGVENGNAPSPGSGPGEVPAAAAEATSAADRCWHATDVEEALGALSVDPEQGLDDAAVRERRGRAGPNRLPRPPRPGLLRIALRQFADPLVYVLLVAGVVSLLIGNHADGAFILAVLALNAGLGTWQEHRAERTAASLESVVSPRVLVRRAGEVREIDSEDLVPGDLVLLEGGDAVPADLRLLETEELRADESLLTGESEPATKHADAEVAADAGVGDRADMAHAVSSVIGGSGLGLVVLTGADTEIGRIARALAEGGEDPPLVQRVRAFTRVIAIAVLAFVVILGGAQYLRGAELVDLFLLAVALAVSAIPAGLPVAITVALSIASARMAEVAVVVRNLPAVEGLGACTLIATDKTGTLTENRLTARRLRPFEDSSSGVDVDVSGTGDELEGRLERAGSDGKGGGAEETARPLIETAVLCNEGAVAVQDGEVRQRGDTLDTALLILGCKAGVERDALLEERPGRGVVPFSSERRYAASFHDDPDGGVLAHVKGAARTVAGMCAVDAERVVEEEEALAAEGFRVIGLARGPVDDAAVEAADGSGLEGLEFLGLVGFIDPVRPGVHDAVARCRAAGVDVCMITGDHPATGLAIARELGLAGTGDEVITGADLPAGDDEATDEELERIRGARVFARVEPLQKTRIVELLQRAGHYVAVTGDGVNDAPALRRAHIGVAMGEGGTDVARDAADLILTDDDFSSIVDGMEQGRVAYDNVRKVVWLLVSTAVAELLLFTLAVATDTPLPLTPVQLLWLNLVTNGIQDVALAFEGAEPDVLKRRPRRPDEPIFDRLMIEEVLTSGFYMGLVAFGAFWWLTGPLGHTTESARNLLVLLLVLFENVHLFNVRSETRSAFRIPLVANRLLIASVVLAQGVHLASMWIPGWRDVLGLAPVSLATWGLLLAVTLSKFAVVELYKALRGRRLAAFALGLEA